MSPRRPKLRPVSPQCLPESPALLLRRCHLGVHKPQPPCHPSILSLIPSVTPCPLSLASCPLAPSATPGARSRLSAPSPDVTSVRSCFRCRPPYLAGDDADGWQRLQRALRRADRCAPRAAAGSISLGKAFGAGGSKAVRRAGGGRAVLTGKALGRGPGPSRLSASVQARKGGDFVAWGQGDLNPLRLAVLAGRSHGGEQGEGENNSRAV